MPTPHDYYDIHGMPRLHNVGEGRPYLENDYHANDHGPQLPAISTIGRGPRGEGLTVGNVVNEDGTVSFALYSDLTGELVWQSPNLDPGTLDFQVTDFRELSAGQPAPLDIVYSKGGVTKTTTAYLPCGDRGSLVFLSNRTYRRNASDTFQTTVKELVIYGHRTYENRPIPRVNDIVFFRWLSDDETGIGFGTIEAVGTSSETEVGPDSPVVFTAHTFIPCAGGSVPLIIEAEWEVYSGPPHPGGGQLNSVNKDEDLRGGTDTVSNLALYCVKRDSNDELIFTEAGIIYEAFTSGRPVFIHAQNNPSNLLSDNLEQYYKIIDASKITLLEGPGKGDEVFQFVAAIPDVNNPKNEFLFKNVISRGPSFFDRPICFYYPAEIDTLHVPVEVRRYEPEVVSLTKGVSNKHSSESGYYYYYCEEYTASEIYKAFTSGVKVLLYDIGAHIVNYEIIDARVTAGKYDFVASLPNVNKEDEPFELVVSEKASADDLPVFIPDSTPSYLSVPVAINAYEEQSESESKIVGYSAFYCGQYDAYDIYEAFTAGIKVLLEYEVYIESNETEHKYYEIVDASKNINYPNEWTTEITYIFTASLPNINKKGEPFELVTSDECDGETYPVFYPDPTESGCDCEPLIVEAYASNNAINCESATASEMFEAFTAGKQVLIHVATSASPKKAAISTEDFYQVISARMGETDLITFVCEKSSDTYPYEHLIRSSESEGSNYPHFPDPLGPLIINLSYQEEQNRWVFNKPASMVAEAFFTGMPIIIKWRTNEANNTYHNYAATITGHIQNYEGGNKFYASSSPYEPGSTSTLDYVGFDDYPYFGEAGQA